MIRCSMSYSLLGGLPIPLRCFPIILQHPHAKVVHFTKAGLTQNIPMLRSQCGTTSLLPDRPFGTNSPCWSTQFVRLE